MPELPEVQTIVSDLKPLIEGKTFESLQTSVPQSVLPEAEAFLLLKGSVLKEISRRGKYINMFFARSMNDNSHSVVTIHLRMTGRLLVRVDSDEAVDFERSRLDFSEGVSLRFSDIRKFGRIWLSTIDSYLEETGMHKLGVEPLSEEFDVLRFKNLFKGRKGSVKKLLLDQRFIAGVGNIYADESCFYAGVRPDREFCSLNSDELERLHGSVVRALEQGVLNRGTSISDYQDAYGQAGMNQEILYVYARGGKGCLQCGNILTKGVHAGRGTVWCDTCQS